MRPFLMIRYPETVFKLAYGSFKNCFRRLPRRAMARLAMTNSGNLKTVFNKQITIKNQNVILYSLPCQKVSGTR
ncbi:MAG: hypothetical protein IKZ88_06115 [Neisseriaceae bacterium]|nr:hypothetical protein [Neisseriaceae bacterium]